MEVSIIHHNTAVTRVGGLDCVFIDASVRGILGLGGFCRLVICQKPSLPQAQTLDKPTAKNWWIFIVSKDLLFRHI